MKIAIFSSASSKIKTEHKTIAYNIGRYLAQQGVTVVTGGCIGLPGIAVDGALAANGTTEAFYPDINEEFHKRNCLIHNNDRLDKYRIKNFFNGFTDRSLRMIHEVDGAIVLNGRIGTLSEFTMALEEGLDICVIKGSGGVSDQLEEIIKIAGRELPNKIIFESDWQKGVDKLIHHLENKKTSEVRPAGKLA